MKNLKLFIIIAIFTVTTAYLFQGFMFSFQQQLVEAKEMQNFERSLSKYDPPAVAVPSLEVATQGGTLQIASQKKTTPTKAAVAVKSINRLVVKSMNVDTPILEGKTTSTLNKGIWHLPGTANPDQIGNTVIAAHRWKWLPTSHKSFYDIDKVKVGDPIEVTWDGVLYTYKVIRVSTVTPEKVEILQNTGIAKLTLFSCAPLFSSKYRLVVEAELISTSNI